MVRTGRQQAGEPCRQVRDGYHPISSKILDLPPWYDRYRASVGDLIEAQADMPWTLCHGDVRLDNLFFVSVPIPWP